MQNFSFLNLDIPLFKEGISASDMSKNSIAMLDQQKYINQDLLNFFKSLNLEIFLIETFFKSPGRTGGIHVDSIGGDYTKLNWVFGGGNSKMCWYKPVDKTPIPMSRTATNTPYFAYRRDQVKEIERTVIKNPTLIQVGIPHDVIDITEDRICVSFVLKDKTVNRRLTMTESRLLFRNFL